MGVAGDGGGFMGEAGGGGVSVIYAAEWLAHGPCGLNWG